MQHSRYAPALLISISLIFVSTRAVRSFASEDPYPGLLPGDSAIAACTIGFDPGSSLSLSRAIDLALCNNAQIRAAWANIRVQTAVLAEAGAAYWPNLSASVSELRDQTTYSGTSQATTAATGNTVFATLDWRLFDFGGRSATHRAAEALLEVAIRTRDATIQKTLGATVQAYFDTVTARSVAEDKSLDESIARETLASAQRRLAQGSSAQNDVLQSAVALARIAVEKNRAIGAYQKAKALLAYVLGVPAGTSIDPAGDVDVRTGTEQLELATWLSNTRQHHPAILAAQAAVEAARDRVVSAQSAGRPTIDFTANYYQNGFPNQGLSNTNMRVATVGITVTVPIFDGFAARHKVQEAQATVRVEEAQLQETEQSTLTGVVEAYADAQTSLGNLEASDELLKAAQSAFESSQRRYAQGAADIVELLSAQTALTDAKSERIQSIANWRSARLNLLASAGRLNRPELQN